FDLLIAADEPQIESAATEIRPLGAIVETVQADLSTTEGVDKLYEASKRIGRPVDALLANAGRGLGHAFLDQDFSEARLVVDTNSFERAGMMDTAVGTSKKDDPADVAKTGFDAMMRGDGDVVTGLKNKFGSAVANVMPAGVLARQHRGMAEPGSAKS